jgi:hypothetical protein
MILQEQDKTVHKLAGRLKDINNGKS